MDWQDMISVGRIVRPQGNRGEVVVESATDFGEERFQTGAILFMERDGAPAETRVATGRPHNGRWVVGFEGVGSIDEAEALRGRELRIPAESLRVLEPGRFYVHDLVGCQVETTAGANVGPVESVRLDTGVPLLVVAGSRGEVLLPFSDAYCREVDIAARRIVIEPVEGLLDVNT